MRIGLLIQCIGLCYSTMGCRHLNKTGETTKPLDYTTAQSKVVVSQKLPTIAYNEPLSAILKTWEIGEGKFHAEILDKTQSLWSNLPKETNLLERFVNAHVPAGERYVIVLDSLSIEYSETYSGFSDFVGPGFVNYYMEAIARVAVYKNRNAESALQDLVVIGKGNGDGGSLDSATRSVDFDKGVTNWTFLAVKNAISDAINKLPNFSQ